VGEWVGVYARTRVGDNVIYRVSKKDRNPKFYSRESDVFEKMTFFKTKGFKKIYLLIIDLISLIWRRQDQIDFLKIKFYFFILYFYIYIFFFIVMF